MVDRVWTKQHFEKIITDVITVRYDFQIEKAIAPIESDLLLHLKVMPLERYH